jgi:eukaryotic-like serine/threonine-protein kinase
MQTRSKSMVLLVALLMVISERYVSDEVSESVSNAGLEDAGRVGVADEVIATVSAEKPDYFEVGDSWQGVALDMPKGPLKGQKRAPCRPNGEVEISRACWVQVGTVSPPCGNDWYEWKGFCYVPVIARERPNTSDEA